MTGPLDPIEAHLNRLDEDAAEKRGLLGSIILLVLGAVSGGIVCGVLGFMLARVTC